MVQLQLSVTRYTYDQLNPEAHKLVAYINLVWEFPSQTVVLNPKLTGIRLAQFERGLLDLLRMKFLVKASDDTYWLNFAKLVPSEVVTFPLSLMDST
jgi:hypothetical protein